MRQYRIFPTTEKKGLKHKKTKKENSRTKPEKNQKIIKSLNNSSKVKKKAYRYFKNKKKRKAHSQVIAVRDEEKLVRLDDHCRLITHAFGSNLLSDNDVSRSGSVARNEKRENDVR